MGREAVDLMLDEPHEPARGDGSTDKENEAEGAEAKHHFGLGALGDAEDDGSEERKQQDGAEVSDGHEFFLPVAREWASTAATTLRRPATTMNLVP